MHPMKHFFLLTIVAATLCAAAPATAQTPAQTKRHIDVLYFHGKQRCATCIAVGTLAREVVEQQFATQHQQGIVRFREIDFSTPEGTKTAEKYEMSFSGLVISKWDNGREQRVEDMTTFAFQYARTDGKKFKNELAKHINTLLKP